MCTCCIVQWDVSLHVRVLIPGTGIDHGRSSGTVMSFDHLDTFVGIHARCAVLTQAHDVSLACGLLIQELAIDCLV